MIEYYDVLGCYIFCLWFYLIWEFIKVYLDEVFVFIYWNIVYLIVYKEN